MANYLTSTFFGVVVVFDDIAASTCTTSNNYIITALGFKELRGASRPAIELGSPAWKSR